MHLCGLLSEKAVSLYCDIDNVRAIVLSPCCLPSRVVSTIVDDANAKGVNQYDYWCQHLHDLIPASEKVLYADENILSVKNAVLVGWK